ncbi:adenine phosphoribosyltransferase [Emcibacter nanhaiensis]|uniref:Adenine phosphoribosyltransferase n=1 Tax=Emcibacter nanhaiensis TaxID=1505037 RepID=A0A501PH78_9PROT|nr:adenine phosphoribosyltransferase [Emcibacter nanhaiensis]TPD59437.1 adenine phosphoribosyltransferase [Emcibacter nanhaiensis]
MSWIRDHIRTIPDYPIPGIQFRDVTTLFQNGRALQRLILEMADHCSDMKITRIAGIEARGFILGGALAHHLGVGFVPVRKAGKLPWKTISREYNLEYGTDTLEIHTDAVEPGDRVLIVDDLIATGGTAVAALELLRDVKAEVIGSLFVIDLPDLGGADKLRAHGCPVHCLVSYEGE